MLFFMSTYGRMNYRYSMIENPNIFSFRKYHVSLYVTQQIFYLAWEESEFSEHSFDVPLFFDKIAKIQVMK